MDYFLLVATISLTSQIGVFILLLGGYMLKRRRRFRQHGVFMLVALVLHVLVMAAIMIPSFVQGVIPFLATQVSDVSFVLVPVHVVAGIVAAVLGGWIVVSWGLRRSLEYCVPKKRWMRVTFFVWFGALLSGFLLYLYFYWSVLFS
jgi:uncharacterized membrane protein YozB (DUF420 family)